MGRPTWGDGAGRVLDTNGRVRVGPASVYARAGRYHCYLRVAGRAIRKSLNTCDAAAAVEAAAKEATRK